MEYMIAAIFVCLLLCQEYLVDLLKRVGVGRPRLACVNLKGRLTASVLLTANAAQERGG